ncbi:MAG: ThiF family adenylyltransferase [Thermoanaerobaculia bacterium]
MRWGAAESWAGREIGSRGYLPHQLQAQNTILLGAGALGSALAELLVRAGLRNLTILDADRLRAGNLVRHTLLLQDLEKGKSERLADRLNEASPHAHVEARLEDFPPNSDEVLKRCAEADLVIDCTADQDVLSHLQDFEWKEECLLTSFALNLGASRLYCFGVRGGSFSSETYKKALNPWICDDRKSRDLANLPREGLGCWHPVFPARADDIWLMASVAMKFLERAVRVSSSRPDFAVFECSVAQDGSFLGIARRGDPPGGADKDPCNS